MEKISDYHPVIDALYAAEKYAVNDLVDLCRAFLDSNINERTVCDIMENARFFNTTDLHAKCLKFIFQSPCYARTVFKSPEFIRCSRDGIESLMKDDKLPLEEKIIDQSLNAGQRIDARKNMLAHKTLSKYAKCWEVLFFM